MKAEALDLLKSTIRYGLIKAEQNGNGEIWVTTAHVVVDTRTLNMWKKMCGANLLEVMQPHDNTFGFIYHLK